MKERTTPAVFSGLRVKERSLFSNVYISLLTISVVSPTPRAKSSVASKIGVLISFAPYDVKISLALSSIKCHTGISQGSISFVPFCTRIIAIFSIPLFTCNCTI